MAVNPTRSYVLVDLQAVGVQSGPGVVAQLCPGAVEVAADVGAEQADRARPPLPVAVNPSEEHVLADLQAVGGQGGPGVVAQLAPVQSRLDADMGAGQADRAVAAAAGGGEPARRNMA